MTRQLPWEQSDPNLILAAQRRHSQVAKTFVNATTLQANGRLSAEATVEPGPTQSAGADIWGLLESVDVFYFVAHGVIRPAQQARPPRVCEFFMCLAVDPEFQEDRLGDYQQRFNDLWVPKFGRRVAVTVYVWHVLRQSGLVDWLIRTFRQGRP
jgi:hypothetical protein